MCLQAWLCSAAWCLKDSSQSTGAGNSRTSCTVRLRRRSACAKSPPLSRGLPWRPSTAPRLLQRDCHIPAGSAGNIQKGKNSSDCSPTQKVCVHGTRQLSGLLMLANA